MKFGLIYELQLPRPWDENSEHRMVQEALVEVEVADRGLPGRAIATKDRASDPELVLGVGGPREWDEDRHVDRPVELDRGLVHVEAKPEQGAA